MARRKRGDPVHGWLVLDKPVGLTSTKALSQVRRLFNAQKAGHAGTLDPLATGVLPVAFGEATKTMSYAVDGVKVYQFRVQWGSETSTDDCEGDVVATSHERPSTGGIEQALGGFVGDIEQTPPAYSAIKIDGARAYDLARSGAEINLAPRRVSIHALQLFDHSDPDHADFEVTCGKGTYVRALARDLGRVLGCLGHVVRLRRMAAGSFVEGDAVSLQDLAIEYDEHGLDALRGRLQPIERALDAFTAIHVEPSDAALLRRGQPVLIRGPERPDPKKPAFARSKGRLIALGDVDKGVLRPFRVFNYGG